MYERDYLKKRALKFKDHQSWNDFKRARNIVTSKVRVEKRSFYTTAVQNCNGNSLWKVLRQVTGNKVKQSLSNDLTADDFNDCFNTIGERTVAHLNVAEEAWVFWNSPDLKSIHSFSFTNISQNAVTAKCINQITGFSR